MKLRLMVSTLCVASLGIAGCASQVTQPDEYSGFLSNYSQLKQAKSPSGVEVMRWVDPQLDLSRYNAVYIEPTQFYPKPQAPRKSLTAPSTALTPTTTRRSSVSWQNPCLWPMPQAQA